MRGEKQFPHTRINSESESMLITQSIMLINYNMLIIPLRHTQTHKTYYKYNYNKTSFCGKNEVNSI